MTRVSTIENELRRIIADHQASGTPLPSERTLAQMLHTSRNTIRRIFGQFRKDGLIQSHQGRGTFAGEPPITMDMATLTSFTEGTRLSGKVPASEVLLTEVIRATPRLSESLHLTVHAPVVHVVRRRLANGVVVSLEDSFFPHEIVPTLLDWDLSRYSIYELMTTQFNARPIRAVQRLDAVAAGQMESEALEVRLRSPLIRITREAYDANDRLVEFAHDLFRPDRIQFVAHSKVQS
ncbi:MAG: GntR family transcriptional regulator [Firmicutes bacterium]|nr:GntR family transcriptional regulator [Bacillota bacterium]